MFRSALPRIAAAIAMPTVLVLSLSAGAPAQADETPGSRGPSIAVIGGTLTSRYTDEPGSVSQGWWSMAAKRVGATSITLSAEGGSSMTQAGNKCQGTTFGQRLRHLKKVDILIVEVGTDNQRICTSQGVRTLGKVANRQHVKRYVRQLTARVDALRIPHHRVYIVSPRGTTDTRRSIFIRKQIKTYTGKRHARFRFIETPRLHTRETFNGVQPNLAGNRVISQSVVAAVARSARTSTTVARASGPGPSVMVVGDSITSWYSNEDGSPSQGWWSILARNLGASSVRTSAEGGSGVNVRGNGCHGTTFGERLSHIRRVDILVIEVGRNDNKLCAANPKYRQAPSDPQTLGIDAYVRALSARVAELGMRPDQVWFVTPWGSRDPALSEPIQQSVRRAVTARAAGFGYVGAPTLSDQHTIDGVHPNRAGNEQLAWMVQAAIQARH